MRFVSCTVYEICNYKIRQNNFKIRYTFKNYFVFFLFSGFGHSTISGIHVFNFQAINNKVKGLGSKVGTLPTTKTGGTVEWQFEREREREWQLSRRWCSSPALLKLHLIVLVGLNWNLYVAKLQPSVVLICGMMMMMMMMISGKHQ